MDRFPYGRAPFFILLVALAAGAARIWLSARHAESRPDLVFATFAYTHLEAYRRALPGFEKKHGVKVAMYHLDFRPLRDRLQSAFLTGASVPDVVELGQIGYFTRGPVEDIPFADITERVHREGLYTNMVASRFPLWSSRGHMYGLPHDVHPVMLAYRRDLIDELGIDVSKLETWDDFAAMGRRVTRDLNGDGIPDRYALELSATSAAQLGQLSRQRGAGLFDESGAVAFDSVEMLETLLWCVRHAIGPERIGYDPGGGQNFAKAINDGLVLFLFCPDWRSKQFMLDLAGLSGKMALMPLPAWHKGGRRTTCWGGTGVFVTKASTKQELAWEFAKYLYLDKEELGKRFLDTNIIPPYKPAWSMPALNEPFPYYGGERIGARYAELAPETPPQYDSPYSDLAESKLVEAYLNAGIYYADHGDEGLRAYAQSELTRCAEYVRRVIGRNVFLAGGGGE